MTWRFAIVVALFAFGGASGAARAELQIPPVTYPKLAAHAASAEGFVPAGWRLEAKRAGDLNGDGKPDVVQVLKQTNPRNVVPNDAMGPDPFDTNPRILAVAFAAAAGGFDLTLENHTLIPRPEYPAMDDPLDPEGVQPGGVEVKNGVLRVTLGRFMSAGGWGMGRTAYAFRFQNGRFELIGYDRMEVRRNTGEIEEISINFSTGRMKTTESSMYTDGPGKVTWTNLRRQTLLTIDRIGNGLEFGPPSR